MARITNSTTRRRKHRALLTRTKGFRHKRKNVFKRAKEAVLKAGPYSYVHRRLRKRTLRQLWNVRIGAAAQANETTYSAIIAGLKRTGSTLNRKVLSEIAAADSAAFTVIAQSTATDSK